MTEEAVKKTRVSQEWPAGLKEQVQDKVGKRDLTKFTVLAVRRQLDDGGMDLGVAVKEARDLAQRMANVLATVGDHEARMMFLASVELPDWLVTNSWPDDVQQRVNAEVVNDVSPDEPMPRPEIDDTPEMQKVGPVQTTRMPEPGDQQYGTESEPVVAEESKLNNMDGVQYSRYQHVHTPEGKCVKNVFIAADADGIKHCPLVSAPPQEKIDEPQAPVAHQPAAPAATGSDSNLFERLKSSGALKPASELPQPEPKVETPVEPVRESVPDTLLCPYHPNVALAPGESCPHCGTPYGTSYPATVEQTAGPDSGPLPEVPAESHPPDAVPLPSGGFVHDAPDLTPDSVPLESPATLAGQPNPFAAPDAAGVDPFPAGQVPSPAGQICPDCKADLEDDPTMCWGCGWEAS